MIAMVIPRIEVITMTNDLTIEQKLRTLEEGFVGEEEQVKAEEGEEAVGEILPGREGEDV